MSPFGDEREDFRMGMVCSTFANVNRGKKDKTFTPQDFIPKFTNTKKIPEKQSVETQLAIVEQLNAMLGGKDLRKQ